MQCKVWRLKEQWSNTICNRDTRKRSRRSFSWANCVIHSSVWSGSWLLAQLVGRCVSLCYKHRAQQVHAQRETASWRNTVGWCIPKPDYFLNTSLGVSCTQKASGHHTFIAYFPKFTNLNTVSQRLFKIHGPKTQTTSSICHLY